MLQQYTSQYINLMTHATAGMITANSFLIQKSYTRMYQLDRKGRC